MRVRVHKRVRGVDAYGRSDVGERGAEHGDDGGLERARVERGEQRAQQGVRGRARGGVLVAYAGRRGGEQRGGRRRHGRIGEVVRERVPGCDAGSRVVVTRAGEQFGQVCCGGLVRDVDSTRGKIGVGVIGGKYLLSQLLFLFDEVGLELCFSLRACHLVGGGTEGMGDGRLALGMYRGVLSCIIRR